MTVNLRRDFRSGDDQRPGQRARLHHGGESRRPVQQERSGERVGFRGGRKDERGEQRGLNRLPRSWIDDVSKAFGAGLKGTSPDSGYGE